MDLFLDFILKDYGFIIFCLTSLSLNFLHYSFIQPIIITLMTELLVAIILFTKAKLIIVYDFRFTDLNPYCKQ